MGFNSLHSNSEGSSFEQGNAINAGLKKKAQDASSQAAQQAKAAGQTFTDQLYGNVPSESTPETLDPSGDPSHSLAQVQKPSAPPPTQNGLTPAANPNEQDKLDRIRRELHDKYVSAAFGEEAQQKRRQAELEEKELKEQEEEAQAEEEAQKKQEMDASLQSFQSHGKGGKGPDQLSAPVAVTQAKTKTESNRGASG